MARATLTLVKPGNSANSQGDSPVQRLPFVHRRASGPNDFWNVPRFRHPDLAGEDALGRLFARETLAAIRETGFTPLLGWIAGAQVEARCFDSITAGFWQEIAEQL